MARFRSRPREIEAFQYEGIAFSLPRGVCLCSRQVMGPHVHTMHKGQQVQLQEGDWVVAEPDGQHYYPIKDEVMQTNYERIDDGKETQLPTNAN